MGTDQLNPCAAGTVKQTFSYDSNGLLTSSWRAAAGGNPAETVTYTNNHLAKLARAASSLGSVTRYFYGPDQEKLADVNAGVTTFYLDPGYTLLNGTPLRYYYLDGERIAIRSGGAPPEYLVNDHLGSVRMILNQSAVAVSEKAYFPFGETLYSVGTNPTRLGFNGRFSDAVGLYDYGARSYRAANGTFAQPDSIVPEEGNPQAFNRYAYVFNNPVKYVDPSGHAPAAAHTDSTLIGPAVPDDIAKINGMPLANGEPYSFNYGESYIFKRDEVWGVVDSETGKFREGSSHDSISSAYTLKYYPGGKYKAVKIDRGSVDSSASHEAEAAVMGDVAKGGIKAGAAVGGALLTQAAVALFGAASGPPGWITTVLGGAAAALLVEPSANNAGKRVETYMKQVERPLYSTSVRMQQYNLLDHKALP